MSSEAGMYTVKDVMSTTVVSIDPEASVSAAMRGVKRRELPGLIVTVGVEVLARRGERGISSLIVLPEPGSTIYGILTKRDVISKVVARNRDPQRIRVNEIMSAPIYTIEPHVTLPQCAARMVAMGVRRLTV